MCKGVCKMKRKSMQLSVSILSFVVGNVLLFSPIPTYGLIILILTFILASIEVRE